ncbi:MAG: radical SAM protein [Planctomycetes bacterium]|nr:radical SAM protein [Planctomycetota bacterium]
MKSDSALAAKYDRSRFTLSNPEPWKRIERIKGAGFAEYRALLARAEKGQVLTGFPVEVLIKTTLNCNHTCPKCLHGMGIFPAGAQFSMKFETLTAVLDEGKRKGLRSVVFTGGEPTMHPRIMEFLSYAGELGFPDISMVTNGSKLSDRLVECLVASGLTRVNVSIDAVDRGTYRKVHGVDQLDRVTEGIERLLRKRKEMGSQLPLLSVSFVLSEENRDELDPFLALWKERADGGIKVYPFKNVFSVVDGEFSKTYGAGKKRLEQLDAGSLPAQLPKDVPMLSGYGVECTSPWYRCHVGINGEIQACTTQGFCDHPAMVMGNIHRSTFEEVWKSARWSELREIVLARQFDRHPVCRVCQRCV